MSVYDLDRFSKRTASISTAKPSLTLHLYPNHARFEHQNGIFKYDSPILPLLDSIRNAKLPVALLDLLDATEVQYIDGCLIVEIRDHRLVDGDNGLPTSGIGSGNGITTVIRDPLSVSTSNTSTQVSTFAKSVLGKRLANGTLKSSSLPNEDSATHAAAGDAASAALHKRFMVTYQRFQEARLDAEALKLKAIVRSSEAGGSQIAANGSTSASTLQSQLKRGSSVSGTQTNDIGAMDTSLHNTVAVANSATSAAAASVSPTSTRSLGIEAIPVYRVILQPDSEAVWADIFSIRNERTMPKITTKFSSMTAAGDASAHIALSEQDLLEAEAKILALTAPPLCLAPDPDLCRIANTLMAASALPSITSNSAAISIKKSKKRKRGGTTSKSFEYNQHFFGANPAVVDVADKLSASEKQNLTSDERNKVGASADDLNAKAVEYERAQKQEWLLVMDESHDRPFQPSFKRVAFLQDWRHTKAEEARRHELAASQRPLQAGQQPRSDVGIAAEALLPENQTVDVQVGGGGDGDIAVEDVHRMLLGQDDRSQAQSAPTPAHPAPTQKKKKAKAGSPAAPDVAVDQTSAATGTANLKFTLPGRKSENHPANGIAAAPPKKKKKDKKAATAAQADDVKVDIAVQMPSDSAAHMHAGSPLPNSAVSASSSSVLPTPAQQAIMRKASTQPKTKLKSEASTQNLSQAPPIAVPSIPTTSDISTNAIDGLVNGQGRVSPSKQTAIGGALPQNSFNSAALAQGNLTGAQGAGTLGITGSSPQQHYAATTTSHLPANMTQQMMQQAAQRAFSPMQNVQLNQQQQQQVYQQSSGVQASALSAALLQQQQTQQAYLNQLTKQTSAAGNTELQAGLAMQRPGSVQLGATVPPLGSFAQQQNTQGFNSQLPHQMNVNAVNPYMHLNRSPMHIANPLSNITPAQQQQPVPNLNVTFNGQQQYGTAYNQVIPNAQMQPLQAAQFTQQQAMQLLAYQQQQQRASTVTPQQAALAQHQQQLQNFSNQFATQTNAAVPQFQQQMLSQLQLQQSQAQQMQQMQGQPPHMQMFPIQNQQQWQQPGR